MLRRQSFGIESSQNVILALTPKHHRPSSSLSNSNPTTPDNSSLHVVPEKTHWACHKETLTSNSNYFNAVFTGQFEEAEASIVFLPRGIFTSTVLDDVLCYMYTKSIKLSAEKTSDDLGRLESLYLAADYLGIESLYTESRNSMIQLTHGLVCYCSNCTLLIPQLLAFAGLNQQNDPCLSQITHSILKLLIQDPEKTIPSFWNSEAMAWLATETETLHAYLESRLLDHVNRNNAIETLFGCFLATSQQQRDRVSQDSEENHWSLLMNTQKRVQQTASKLLADHFDFYCTKYPKLLSCVDGITYSFDFLNYLMCCMLDEMNQQNACSLYKGVVRSLMCRDSVQRTPQVKDILQTVKTRIVRYIGSHLTAIKEQDAIDKSVIEGLAQDLVIPLNTLLVQDDSKLKHTVNKRSTAPTTIPATAAATQKGANWNSRLKSRLCTMVFGQASLHFKVGQRVQLLNRPVLTIGTIAFVGKLEGEEGHFLGVELDRSVGSNNGSIGGRSYFTTLTNKGIFVKQSQVILI